MECLEQFQNYGKDTEGIEDQRKNWNSPGFIFTIHLWQFITLFTLNLVAEEDGLRFVQKSRKLIRMKYFK